MSFQKLIPIFGGRLNSIMQKVEPSQLGEKIEAGVKLAIRRMIERAQKEDGELVVSRDGKVVRIKARSVSLK